MEGYEAILKRCQSKEPRHDIDKGRDHAALGMSADAPLNYRILGLKNAVFFTEELHRQELHREAKSMLDDFVERFSDDQPDVELRGWGMKLLHSYVVSCSMTRNNQDKVKCCKKALRVAGRYDRMMDFKFEFHYFLGLTYVSMGDLRLVREEVDHLKETLRQVPELAKSMIDSVEDLEGQLELLLATSIPYDIPLAAEHLKKGVDLLKCCLERRRKHCQSKENTYKDKFDMLMTALRLGDGLRRGGDPKFSYTIFQLALETAKDLNINFQVADAAVCCGGLALILGENEAAERYFREGLKAFGSQKEYLVANLYKGLGKALMNLNRLPEAVAEFRIAVNVLSHLSLQTNHETSKFRISYLESIKEVYSDFQLCLYEIYSKTPESQQGIKALKEALVISERGRCRDLLSNLEENLNSRDRGKSTLTDRSVDKLDWKLFDKNRKYGWEHLEYCMRICADAVKKQNAGVKRVTFVEYTLLAHRLLIWVLHSNGTQEPSTSQATTPKSLPSMFAVDVRAHEEMVTEGHPELEKNLEDNSDPDAGRHRFQSIVQSSQAHEAVRIVQDMLEKLKDADMKANKLVKLYDLLIQPIASKLHSEEPVIFIPHEVLSLVPFGALMPKVKGEHLIEKHPIRIAPSLRALGWATNRYSTLKLSAENPTSPMLFVADPSPLVDKSLKALPNAVTEVETITTVLRNSNYQVTTLKKEQATLESVTSGMKLTPWFHIACHGEVKPDVYPQGVLFLAGGCLTHETILHDVRSMAAHAAVLSACKAGQGKQTGEGQLGLARAFIQAGVPLVIAPLPMVNSIRTNAFMQHFYDRLLAGESVMFALRITMVDAIKKRIKGPGTWKLWDWAAWQAVGFPGVCLPSASGSDS